MCLSSGDEEGEGAWGVKLGSYRGMIYSQSEAESPLQVLLLTGHAAAPWSQASRKQQLTPLQPFQGHSEPETRPFESVLWFYQALLQLGYSGSSGSGPEKR